MNCVMGSNPPRAMRRARAMRRVSRFGAALRESLARWLGIEPRELGISVAARDGQLGRKTPSVYLFDEASGGAGYAPRLLDDIYHVFERASHVLDCPKECEMGCSACVLAPDLYKQQGRLDRNAALIAVRAFLETNAELPEEDRAVADANTSCCEPEGRRCDRRRRRKPCADRQRGFFRADTCDGAR